MKDFFEWFYIGSTRVGAITCLFENNSKHLNWESHYRLGMKVEENLILYSNKIKFRIEEKRVLWTESIFELGNKRTVLKLSENGLIINNKLEDKDKTNRILFPDFAYYLAIYQLVLLEKDSLQFDYINSQSGEVMSNCGLKIVGKEEILVNGRLQQATIIQESKEGKPSNKYLLDKSHRILKSDWQGAVSHVVKGKQTAIIGLDSKIQLFLK